MKNKYLILIITIGILLIGLNTYKSMYVKADSGFDTSYGGSSSSSSSWSSSSDSYGIRNNYKADEYSWWEKTIILGAFTIGFVFIYVKSGRDIKKK